MLHSYQMVFPVLDEPFAYLSGKTFQAPVPAEFTRMFGSLIWTEKE